MADGGTGRDAAVLAGAAGLASDRATLLRWAVWVVGGLLAGLLVGFALGLTRPQAER